MSELRNEVGALILKWAPECEGQELWAADAIIHKILNAVADEYERNLSVIYREPVDDWLRDYARQAITP